MNGRSYENSTCTPLCTRFSKLIAVVLTMLHGDRKKEAWFIDYIIEHTHRVSRSSITSSSFTWHLPLSSSLLTSYLTDKLKNVQASDLCLSQHKYWLYEAVPGLSISLSVSSRQCDRSAAPGSFHTRLLRWVVCVRSNNGWFKQQPVLVGSASEDCSAS